MKGGDAVKETDGQLLARLGDDATKWAAEFRQTAIRLGYSDMDEGWLISWFANAIEHSSQVRAPSPAPSPEPQDVREALTAAKRTLAAYQKQGAPHAFVGDISLQKVHALIETALAQSDVQPVGWQAKPIDEPEWSVENSRFFSAPTTSSALDCRPLYTAPHSPDASGLIEAADLDLIISALEYGARYCEKQRDSWTEDTAQGQAFDKRVAAMYHLRDKLRRSCAADRSEK